MRPPPDLWGSVVKTTLFGAIIAIVSCYKGMTASGGAEGVGRAVNQGVVIEFLGIFAFNYVFTQTLLATHPENLGDQVDGEDLAIGPKDWIASFGDIAKFCARVVANVFNGRVFHFFGEALRQAGILILGSALVIWGSPSSSASSAGSRAPTSTARWARPRTPASSAPGATCARSCPTRSAT